MKKDNEKLEGKERRKVAKAYCTCKEVLQKSDQKMNFGHREVEVNSDDTCVHCGFYVFWSIDIKKFKNRGFPIYNREQERKYMNNYYFETHKSNIRIHSIQFTDF